ncbi:hypothetical protein [Roseicyclus mahoneyensis]|uniref:hypothetical protein n=1 Tax=Roseicyclus mahoneyensis TaxID=164332 RepID=UPI0011B277CF|nr:hypothetical protein [Roseicyclus mahoneyensis]
MRFARLWWPMRIHFGPARMAGSDASGGHIFRDEDAAAVHRSLRLTFHGEPTVQAAMPMTVDGDAHPPR